MKIDYETYQLIVIWVAILAIGALLAPAAWIVGCTDPPPARSTPLAEWRFEGEKAVLADSTAKDFILSAAYLTQGEIVEIPTRWRSFYFVVPERGLDVDYEFQWAPPGGAWSTLAIAVVDSMDSGVVWIAARDIEPGDRVRLVLPWEGYQ